MVRTGVCFEGTASRICWLTGYKAWANGAIKDAAKVSVVNSRRTVASSSAGKFCHLHPYLAYKIFTHLARVFSKPTSTPTYQGSILSTSATQSHQSTSRHQSTVRTECKPTHYVLQVGSPAMKNISVLNTHSAQMSSYLRLPACDSVSPSF